MRWHAAAFAVLACAGLAAPLPASGCGYCIEDRVAAVYDHAVITSAIGRRHQVAFFAVEGPLPAVGDSRRLIGRALASTPAVDAESIRVSVDWASLSLSYDAKRVSLATLGALLNRNLASRGLKVSLLQSLDYDRP